ncbi:MAG: hypothetical protein ACO25B_13715 [Chitinophagaceae bacterium]
MYLLVRFFSPIDAAAFPICLLVCYFIFKSFIQGEKDEETRRFYNRAFKFKVLCVLAFTFLTEFYFKGGDTSLYYQAAKDLQAAVKDNPDNFWVMLFSERVTVRSPLFDFFYYDGYDMDLTYQYMISPPNFFPPKLAFFPLYMFFGSYISINMCFGFFALLGSIQLFRFFRNYFPSLKRQLALACLFLPSVAYWSAGLLKDPITFGSVGFVLYAFYDLFRGKKIFLSLLTIIVCGFFLYTMKVYILLVLVLAIVVWQFTEVNKRIENKTLSSIFTVMAFGVGAVVGVFLMRYFTSMEAGQEYQFDKLAGNIEYQQQMYAAINQQLAGKDSYFTINTSNPAAMVFGGLTATFFRPLVWEINTPIALLSAIESNIFLFLTLFFLFKRGVRRFFSLPFADSITLMCFVFSIVFAVAVGVSTSNFGALSRYKIPCMPFYLVFLILLYNKAGLAYPRWFLKIVDFAVPARRQTRFG